MYIAIRQYTPKLIPRFNEMGTIAGMHVSAKRLVIFINKLMVLYQGHRARNLEIQVYVQRWVIERAMEICRFFNIISKSGIP